MSTFLERRWLDQATDETELVTDDHTPEGNAQ